MEQKITIDRETFKALAAETRIEILKLLNKRRYMQSELAEILGLAVPTVKEHLDSMEKAGLVEMIDEGRKWKYYRLTKKGKCILEPEETKILVVIIILVLGALGGVFGVIKQMLAPFYAGQRAFGTKMIVQEAAVEKMAETIPAAGEAMPALAMANETARTTAKAFPWGFVVYIGIMLILIGILIYLLYKRKKTLEFIRQS